MRSWVPLNLNLHTKDGREEISNSLITFCSCYLFSFPCSLISAVISCCDPAYRPTESSEDHPGGNVAPRPLRMPMGGRADADHS
jgi:hypothetical protein